jgi:hypothetical protein
LSRGPGGVEHVALGGERIRRPGREHDVVGGDLLAGGQPDTARLDLRGALVHDPPVAQQPRVGEEDPLEPLRLDQRAPGGDVVHERVLRFDQRDVGDVVKAAGDGDAAVAAADHGDGGAGGRLVAHRDSSGIRRR